MRGTRAAGAILALGILSGCAGPEDSLPGSLASVGGDGAEAFAVPLPSVGDRARYTFSFQSGTTTFEGETALVVVGETSADDAYGRVVPAVHLRQSNPDGSFAEDYFLDARTLQQFKLVRNDQYSDTATLTPPAGMLPTRRSYANATGDLQRYALDPIFEDANFFGLFASGSPLPASGPFEIQGNLWERNGTRLLTSGPWNGTAEAAEANATWGEVRRLSFEASFDGGDQNRETMYWNGDFSAEVPFAVRIDRNVVATFFGDSFDVRFKATLLEFTKGTGKTLARESPGPAPTGAGERAAWTRMPVDGSGAALAFPLSEAIAALERDPIAIQYFQNHAGSYLYLAEMEDIDTCKFSPTFQMPGCHWLQWDGIFFAPDDWLLYFTVEKYAQASGQGASYAPVLAREQIFDAVFEAAGLSVMVQPEAAIRAEQSTMDLPERSAFPGDALTIAGALGRWADGAAESTAALAPNSLFLHLTRAGYMFSVAHVQWEFPSQNPELFPFYDDMPFELTRHSSVVLPDGFVVEHRNYDVAVEHK